MARMDRWLNRLNSLLPYDGYNFADRSACVRQHVAYMLDRTQRMFEYTGLPDTIPARMLELYLQTNGNACFYQHNGELYVFTGGAGGEPDVYYRPTIYTVANPALKLSKALRIGEDCEIVANDSLFMGLLPMFNRYAAAITEAELSIRVSEINARIVAIISAHDDATKASAEEYLKHIIDGDIGVIAENQFLDGVRVQPAAQSGNSNILTNLIEVEQYFKASWYNEIGINANFNMKREALNSGETDLNNDALFPLIDDMLECRREGIKRVNDHYGLNIQVNLASSWEDNQQELDLLQNSLSVKTENITEGVEE